VAHTEQRLLQKLAAKYNLLLQPKTAEAGPFLGKAKLRVRSSEAPILLKIEPCYLGCHGVWQSPRD
jgi:hypothetical protein